MAASAWDDSRRVPPSFGACPLLVGPGPPSEGRRWPRAPPFSEPLSDKSLKKGRGSSSRGGRPPLAAGAPRLSRTAPLPAPTPVLSSGCVPGAGGGIPALPITRPKLSIYESWLPGGTSRARPIPFDGQTSGEGGTDQPLVLILPEIVLKEGRRRGIARGDPSGGNPIPWMSKSLLPARVPRGDGAVRNLTPCVHVGRTFWRRLRLGYR